MDDLLTVLHNQPDDPLALATLADLYEEQGKPVAAIRFRRKALVAAKMNSLMLDGMVNPEEFMRRYGDRKSPVDIAGPKKKDGYRTWYIGVDITAEVRPHMDVRVHTTYTSSGWTTTSWRTWYFYPGDGWISSSEANGPVIPEVFQAMYGYAKKLETRRAKKQIKGYPKRSKKL